MLLDARDASDLIYYIDGWESYLMTTATMKRAFYAFRYPVDLMFLFYRLFVTLFTSLTSLSSQNHQVQHEFNRPSNTGQSPERPLE